jgi:hypothetical protein
LVDFQVVLVSLGLQVASEESSAVDCSDTLEADEPETQKKPRKVIGTKKTGAT